jgi:molybdopterin molybdotransferase
VTALDWASARSAAHAAGLAAPRRAETAPLDDALGRTLAEGIVSPTDVPGVDISAMDGWAVAGEGPWTLGSPLRAGSDPDTAPLPSGSARPVTTGAPVPPGTDSVLRSEEGEVGDGVLVAGRHDPRAPGPRRHIRRAGEEIRIGDLLLTAGLRLTPPRIALAAVAGLDELTVARRPRSGLAVLGDEVVGSGIPRPGTVRDVFSPQLPGILTALGAQHVSSTRVADDRGATVAALDRPDLDLLVTTGGTAGSGTDHIRGALAALGAELLIDRVAMRPGHPVIVARRGSTLHLCLPGNPMAALVGLIVLGIPLVDGLLGRAATPVGSTTLAVDIAHDRVGSLIVAYRRTDGGALPAERQSAAMLRGLAEADGLLVVSQGGASAGDTVPALGLPW